MPGSCGYSSSSAYESSGENTTNSMQHNSTAVVLDGNHAVRSRARFEGHGIVIVFLQRLYFKIVVTASSHLFEQYIIVFRVAANDVRLQLHCNGRGHARPRQKILQVQT